MQLKLSFTLGPYINVVHLKMWYKVINLLLMCLDILLQQSLGIYISINSITN